MIDLKRLAAFFSPDDIEWKPLVVSKRTGKGLAAAYLTNRAIMDRLDDVCGPENWWNEYRPGPGGGVICGITIRTAHGPVTKWDGAENTDVESVKGGLSNSMKRAATHWGIGRYLYELPQQWVPIDERGRFVQPPRIPSAFLPQPQGRPEARGDGGRGEGRRGDGQAGAPPPPPQRQQAPRPHPQRRSA